MDHHLTVDGYVLLRLPTPQASTCPAKRLLTPITQLTFVFSLPQALHHLRRLVDIFGCRQPCTFNLEPYRLITACLFLCTLLHPHDATLTPSKKRIIVRVTDTPTSLVRR
jgi:hypothetical protein